MSSKIIVVSTRPPTSPLSGGMAPAVKRACDEFHKVVWYAVGNDSTLTHNFENSTNPKHQTDGMKTFDVEGIHVKQIMVSATTWDEHYNKYSNSNVWPLCHDRLDLVAPLHQMDYAGNFFVNEEMARAIAEDLARTNDSKTPIWVHDYHHFTMPSFLRKHGVQNPIVFFNHIPLPDPKNLDKMAPDAKGSFLMTLKGLLECDAINFQTAETTKRFLKLIGLETPPTLAPYDSISVGFMINDRFKVTKIGHYPISIDTPSITAKSVGNLSMKVSRQVDKGMTAPYIFLNFERCDYSKGILPRLLAFEDLLQKNPQFAGDAQIVIGAEPTRSDIPEYKKYAEDVVKIIERINKRTDWHNDGNPPVILLPKQIPNEDVVKMMRQNVEGQRKICTVTPYRDGMNLVSKEFIAAQAPENAGVLILSSGAGAASELDLDGKGAVTYNPDHGFAKSIDEKKDPIRDAMLRAITMPQDEANERCRVQREQINKYDLALWAKEHKALLTDIAGNTRSNYCDYDLSGAESFNPVVEFKRSIGKYEPK